MEEVRWEAAFIARFTAGATHEVRNVLAIVKESAGLVEDLLEAAGPGGVPDHDRIRAALARIDAQVGRGADLMTSLNRLAHGLDRPEEAVDLADAIRHVVRLYQRFARDEKRTVHVPEDLDSGTVTANALQVYLALATMLEWHLERVPRGGTLLVTTEPGEDRVAVRFRHGKEASRELGGPADEEWALLEERLAGLPARLDGHGSEQGVALVFS